MSNSIVGFDLGTINTSYCQVRIKDLKILKWGMVDIKDSTNEGSCKKLVNKLNPIDLCSDGDTMIVIEQQPRINVKTIMISGFVHMYYTMKKMERVESEEDYNITKIVGHHAKHKIKYYEPREGDGPMPERLAKLKKGHYQTKQICIEHCRRVMKHNEESQEWIDFFEKSVKKDDLADSFLMTLSYIKMNKLQEKLKDTVN